MMKNTIKLKNFLFLLTVIICLFSYHVIADEYDTVTELDGDNSILSVIQNGKSNYIYGGSSDVVLTLPATLELAADLKIDNLTLSGTCSIYANGFKLYIGSGVTSDSRLTVYGGARNASVISTNLELYGGMYKTVYAGGNGGTVTGDTNLIFGGNCNIGDGINDKDTTTMSPCNLYGGGNNGAVLGKTNVYLRDNAVAAYIFGAGTGTNGTAVDTNINISGGKVMNVYGGSSSTVLTNCNTHITMTGGMAESVFGASSQSNLTGNTYLTLLGGEVTRRVYTGCYNDWSLLWKTDYYVDGTTNLVIGKDMRLNTKNELSSQNQTNIGVFCGSRCGRNGNSKEKNTVMFLDGCYDFMKGTLGDKSGLGLVFFSHPTYTANISSGGNVSFGGSAGVLECTPLFGKYMTVNGSYTEDTSVSLTSGSVDVIDFRDNFAVSSFDVAENNNGTSTITIEVVRNNIANVANPRIFLSLTNADGRCVNIFTEALNKDKYNFTTNIAFTKADVLILKDNFTALCKKYTATISSS